MHCDELAMKVFPKFFKPTPAILPAMHEVKQCTLSRMFRPCTIDNIDVTIFIASMLARAMRLAQMPDHSLDVYRYMYSRFGSAVH